MKKQLKCYIYTRVSTSIQVDGYSLDAQKDKLHKYADYQNTIIAGEYSDEGKSGKSVEGRPQFQQMLQDIESGKDNVETVVLLSQQKADDYLEVEIDLDELDATSAETKATYEEIKKYVAEHNDGMKVSNLYIAQVKKKCGIELGQNFNLPKSENAKQPQCPKEKEDAIVEALKAFQMI